MMQMMTPKPVEFTALVLEYPEVKEARLYAVEDLRGFLWYKGLGWQYGFHQECLISGSLVVEKLAKDLHGKIIVYEPVDPNTCEDIAFRALYRDDSSWRDFSHNKWSRRLHGYCIIQNQLTYFPVPTNQMEKMHLVCFSRSKVETEASFWDHLGKE